MAGMTHPIVVTCGHGRQCNLSVVTYLLHHDVECTPRNGWILCRELNPATYAHEACMLATGPVGGSILLIILIYLFNNF